MSKKAQALYRKNVETLVTDLGAVTTGYPYRWQINTKCGLLRLSVHETDESRLFGFYMRFEDPGAATRHFLENYLDIDNLNRHSGKYNHYSEDMEWLLQRIKSRLKKLI